GYGAGGASRRQSDASSIARFQARSATRVDPAIRMRTSALNSGGRAAASRISDSMAVSRCGGSSDARGAANADAQSTHGTQRAQKKFLLYRSQIISVVPRHPRD